MCRRDFFFVALFGTGVLVFLAQSTEYRGLEYMQLAGFLCMAAMAGTFASAVLALRAFETMRTRDGVLAAGSCTVVPFAVDWLLSVNHTALNVHGFAILGYFIYALGSWLCAIGLLIATAVRDLRSK